MAFFGNNKHFTFAFFKPQCNFNGNDDCNAKCGFALHFARGHICPLAWCDKRNKKLRNFANALQKNKPTCKKTFWLKQRRNFCRFVTKPFGKSAWHWQCINTTCNKGNKKHGQGQRKTYKRHGNAVCNKRMWSANCAHHRDWHSFRPGQCKPNGCFVALFNNFACFNCGWNFSCKFVF